MVIDNYSGLPFVWEMVKLGFSLLAFACSVLFGTACWIVRLEVHRALERLAQLEARCGSTQRDIDDLREWTRTVFAFHRLTPVPGPPPGHG